MDHLFTLQPLNVKGDATSLAKDGLKMDKVVRNLRHCSSTSTTTKERKRFFFTWYKKMDKKDCTKTLKGEEPDQDSMNKVLNGYFLPMKNIPFERHTFNSIKQNVKAKL